MMRAAKIYSFALERAYRQQDQTVLLAQHDELECVKCSRLTKPHHVSVGFTTSYRCDGGQEHRPFTWRINANGDMLVGASGNRFYRG